MNYTGTGVLHWDWRVTPGQVVTQGQVCYTKKGVLHWSKCVTLGQVLHWAKCVTVGHVHFTG